MKTIILAISIALAAPAAVNAKCMTNDKWLGRDKIQHFVVGSTIGFGATLATKDPMQGFLWGVGIGAVKELVDMDGSGTCSLQDLGITALGAAFGAWGGKFVLRKTNGGMSLSYATEF